MERIAVENPTPLRYFGLPRYDQIIEPYMFGGSLEEANVFVVERPATA